MIVLSPHASQPIFERYLNHIYCLKSHWVERLPDIAFQAKFDDLRYAIEETIEDVESQLKRLESIYQLLDITPGLGNCAPLIDFIEQSCSDIYAEKDKGIAKDLTILYYLQIVESMETSSFRALGHLSSLLEHTEVSQLLKECLDESKADRALLDEIIQKRLKIPD